MKNLILGVVLSLLAMYVWGMIYWAANPLPYSTWKSANDDAVAMQALRDHFPETGTYYLPGMRNDEETLMRLHEQGPVGFVHITARDGRPMMMPSIFLQGALLYVVTAVLLALMLQLTGLPTYAERFKLVALAGLAAAIAVEFGHAVWWQISWAWKMQQALYDLTNFIVAGLVLAKFVRPQGPPAENA